MNFVVFLKKKEEILILMIQLIQIRRQVLKIILHKAKVRWIQECLKIVQPKRIRQSLAA